MKSSARRGQDHRQALSSQAKGTFYVRNAAQQLFKRRPIKLTDGPLTGHVQTSTRFVMKTISRADVAWSILNLAEDPRPRQHRTPVLTSAGTQRNPAHPQAVDLTAR